jgi:hypothetical protein
VKRISQELRVNVVERSRSFGDLQLWETQTEVSFDLGSTSREALDRLLEKLDHEAKMLRNLIKKL